MDNNMKRKLNELLKNNKSWPVIIEGGVKKEDFLSATVLPATVPSASLGVINDIGGLKMPDWVKSVEARKNAKANLLLIEGLDTISEDEQLKFKGILDGKSLNGFKLPENMQIAILINDGNRAKINREILSLSLYYKVGE